MKDIFKIGDQRQHEIVVTKDDLATFESGNVHPVCSTFALGRAMEWSSRLFVLDLKEEDEEGVGTALEIKHLSPALEDDRLTITAVLESVRGNEILCAIEVRSGDRLIAIGKTAQKILKRTKIATLIQNTRSNG